MKAENENSTSLSEQIYQKLKWALIIGDHPPGKLLSIRSIAAELGTSTMPVREALNRLASERILQSSAKRSYRVNELDAKRVADQFFVRAQLEGIATSIAIPNLTVKEIKKLASLARKMMKDIQSKNHSGYILGNYQFHFCIYGACGNEELIWSIERLWAQTGPFLAHVVKDQVMPEDWKLLHVEIVAAIKDKDAEKAEQLIEKDISWSIQTFTNMNNGQA